MDGKLTCVDLFAGAGGFSLGFQQAGFEIVAAIDRSKPALETYAHNLEDVTTVEADLQAVSPDDLLEKAGISADEVDVVIGGPPCKGFSTAGKMDPNNPKNSLVANYINIVSSFSPEAVIMENVTGILSMKDGKYKERIISAFRSEGYEISDEPAVLNAADFGVPQQRERVFFFASKNELLSPPEPTHFDPRSDTNPSTANTPWVSLEQAIGDLSGLTYGEKAEKYPQHPESNYQKKMRTNVGEELFNHKATNHGKRVRTRFQQLAQGDSGTDLPEKYQTQKHSLQRWHAERPAPTVTTLPDDFVHYKNPRIPTVRELARVQSFPDNFEFKGPRTTGGQRRRNTVPQYSQVGNAVPPLLAEKVANAVKKQLNIATPA